MDEKIRSLTSGCEGGPPGYESLEWHWSYSAIGLAIILAIVATMI